MKAKKNFVLLVLSLVVSALYITFDFIMQKKELTPKEKITFSMNFIHIVNIEPLLKVNYSDNDIKNTIGNWELWRYRKPEVKEEKSEKKKKTYIEYKLRKIRGREVIYNPKNRKESWEFYGVFIVNKKPFAIFYNPYKKEGKYKILTEGDELAKNLKIDKISPVKIILKFPISEEEYKTLELKVFYVDIEKFKKKLEKESKK